MRFFTPILAISAAALSIATTTTSATSSGLTITAVQFYEPLEPTEDDNISVNIEIEAGDVTDTCVADWKYGKDGTIGYPTTFTACSSGDFSFYFKSYTSLSQWILEAKYTYSIGTKVETVLGEASVTSEDLYCEAYLNSNRCELADTYSVTGLPLSKPVTE